MRVINAQLQRRTLLGDLRLVSRRRRLLGDDTTDFFAGASATPLAVPISPIVSAGAPDIFGTPSFGPIPTVNAPGPALPPSFFAPSSPIIPAPVAQPAPVAPQFPGVPQGVQANLTAIPPVQIVFPSQGAVATSRPVAAPSFFDQQLITGVPNTYLLLGAAAIALFAFSRSGRRRR